MPRLSPEALASLIAVNVTPLAGAIVLGWPPAGVLISYFVDTFVGFCAVFMLMMIHLTGDEQNTPIEGWKRWARLVAAFVFLAAIVLLPLALPLLAVLGARVIADTVLESPAFRLGLALQVLMSVLAAMRIHRDLVATHDDDRILSARLFFLAARWLLLFLAGVTGAMSMLGPRLGALVLIALYAGASIYFELFPEQAMRFVRGSRMGPIKYEDDLETRAAKRRGQWPPKG